MTEIIIPIITGIVCLAVGVVIGFLYRKSVAEKAIGDAETEATRIINEAIKAGETKKRESVLEAKDEIHRQRVEADRELKERRNETQQLERRLIQREEALDKKSDTLDRKNEELSCHLESVQKKENELQRIKDEQVEKLEQIASMTRDEAREMLVNSIEAEAQHDAAVKVREINQRLKDESEQTAREIISTAIQRCAADHVSEATVSVVPLPNDEMKGRIIGREGRNIRTLETLTGVDLIIDDTPEAITLSSFDPVRREIARLALEKLIVDGRIHPARIEEMVEKSRREVEQIIKSEGERATFETGIHGIHPELIKILGRLRYRTSYGRNVLQHSIEVAHIAGMMASELGLDPVQARRAGLLHDIGKAIDHEVEGSHVQIGVDLAKKYKESPLPVRAHAARTSRTTSSVWKSWKASQTKRRAFRARMRSRQAARSASSSTRTRYPTMQWFCSRATSPRRSRTSWIIPARSRSTWSARPAPSTTQSKILSPRLRRGDFFGRKEGISRRFQPFTKNLFVYPL